MSFSLSNVKVSVLGVFARKPFADVLGSSISTLSVAWQDEEFQGTLKELIQKVYGHGDVLGIVLNVVENPTGEGALMEVYLTRDSWSDFKGKYRLGSLREFSGIAEEDLELVGTTVLSVVDVLPVLRTLENEKALATQVLELLEAERSKPLRTLYDKTRSTIGTYNKQIDLLTKVVDGVDLTPLQFIRASEVVAKAREVSEN